MRQWDGYWLRFIGDVLYMVGSVTKKAKMNNEITGENLHNCFQTLPNSIKTNVSGLPIIMKSS